MKRSLNSATCRLPALIACATGALALAGCGDRAETRAPATPSTEVAAVDTPKPAYPLELACAGVGGEVILSLTIGPDGRPSDVSLVKTSGNDALDQVAIDGVRDWRFKPATRNGQPHPQAIQVPVNFNVPQVRPDECFALDATN